MESREMYVNAKSQMKSHGYGLKNLQIDNREKMIYERYHSGKTLILDDLRYLWLKNPDGCEKIAKRVMGIQLYEENGNQSSTKESALPFEGRQNKEDSRWMEADIFDYRTDSNTAGDSWRNVTQTITAIRSMLQKMNEKDVSDVLAYMHKKLEIKKQAIKIEYQNEGYLNQITAYSYEEDKRFDVIV